MTKKRMREIIINSSEKLGNGINCILKDNIPKEILDSAIENYAYGIESDSVIAMLDISKKKNMVLFLRTDF